MSPTSFSSSFLTSWYTDLPRDHAIYLRFLENQLAYLDQFRKRRPQPSSQINLRQFRQQPLKRHRQAWTLTALDPKDIPAAYYRPSTTMCQSPSQDTLSPLLSPILKPGETVTFISPLRSPRPHRIYRVTISDGRTLHLILPPSPSVWRPLRSEQESIMGEAATVSWITGQVEQRSRGRRLSENQGGKSEGRKRGERETEKQQELKEQQNNQDSKGEQKEQQPEHSTSLQRPRSNDDNPLPALLPTLLYQGPSPSPFPNTAPSSYAIYQPTEGTPISFLPQPLSPQAQTNIDFQLGRLFRHLAQFTSPTGRFGPVPAVLAAQGSPGPRPSSPGAPPTITDSPPGFQLAIPAPGGGSLMSTGGAAAWSTAFHSMLEGVLRDGEDMAVAIPYATIRRHFRRLGYVLDAVREGRLVVVRGGKEGVVLVKKEEEEEEEEGEKGGYKLRGLGDWSSAVFGDVLLATVFSDPLVKEGGVREGFVRGFNGEGLPPSTSASEQGSTTTQFVDLMQTIDPSLVQSPETAPTRILLYQVYHAVSRIVSEFYRPSRAEGSTSSELEARKKLNEVLAKLTKVSDYPLVSPSQPQVQAQELGSQRQAVRVQYPQHHWGEWYPSIQQQQLTLGEGSAKGDKKDTLLRKHRRMSGEMSPAKKVKSDDEDDGK